MNENLPFESQKLIMKDNLANLLDKEKLRKMILNNPTIKNDHIFDKFNCLGGQEETNDKTNNINSPFNQLDDFQIDVNFYGKKKNIDKEISDIKIKHEENELIIKKNLSLKNEYSEKKGINKNLNSANLVFKNNSYSNDQNLQNNFKNISISKSNIYTRNKNNDINHFAENIINKIFKEDSFNSKKTIEIIRQKKSPLVSKRDTIEEKDSEKNLIAYFENFKKYFEDEVLLKQMLIEIFSVLKENKILEKIINNLNISENNYKKKEKENNKEFNLNLSKSKDSNNNLNIRINKIDEKIVLETNKKQLNELCKGENNTKDIINLNDNIISKNNRKTNNLFQNHEIKKNDLKNSLDLLNETKKNPTMNLGLIKNLKDENINVLTQSNLKENITNNNLDLNFFEKNPIGPICEMEKIYFLCRLQNSKEEIKKLSKDLEYWRLILGDGNCFYRAFMFSLIELWILQKNSKDLEKMICDVFQIFETEKNNDLLKQKNFHKLEICGILCLILDNIKKKKTATAYEILLKSYQRNKNFDIGLIVYMRLVLFNYISKYRDFYYNSESQIEIGHLLPNEFIDECENFLFEDFFRDFLLRINSEAEKIIIYLSPIIFGVNLDLFILEGLAKANYPYYNYDEELNSKTYYNEENNSFAKDNSSEIKLIREYFPCKAYFQNTNVEKQNPKTEPVFDKNLNSRNKSYIQDLNFDSLNNYYFNLNTNMLMTIREMEDITEKNNKEEIKFEDKKDFNMIALNNDKNMINIDINKSLQMNSKIVEDEDNFSIRSRSGNYDFKNDHSNKRVNLDKLEKEKWHSNYNTISLLYRSAHYDKVYTKNFIEIYENIDLKSSNEFIFNINEFLLEDRKILILNFFCEKCNRDSSKITFKHIHKLGFYECQMCLLDYLKSVFKERVKNFVEGNYNDLECK